MMKIKRFVLNTRTHAHKCYAILDTHTQTRPLTLTLFRRHTRTLQNLRNRRVFGRTNDTYSQGLTHLWRAACDTHANNNVRLTKRLRQKCASELKYRSKNDTCNPMTDVKHFVDAGIRKRWKCLMHVCMRERFDAATIDYVKHTSRHWSPKSPNNRLRKIAPLFCD